MKALPHTTTLQQTVANTAVAGGGDAVVTLAAATDVYHVIDSVIFGYNVAPNAGSLLTVADSGTLFSVPVRNIVGLQQVSFGDINGLAGASGSAVTITLDDGGQIKSLNVVYR